MPSSQTTVKLDLRRLKQLEREAPGRANQILRKIAFDHQEDMQINMNTVSPAPAGEPPGQPTGTLKNSILVSKVRQYLWSVRVGAFYGVFQEFGTRRMEARPFWRPSIKRIAKGIPSYFKALLK